MLREVYLLCTNQMNFLKFSWTILPLCLLEVKAGGGGCSMFYSSNMIRKFLNFDPLNNGLLSVCTTLGIQNKAKMLSSLYNTAFNLLISYWSTEIHDRLGTGNIAFKIVFSFLAILTNQNFFARVDNSLMTFIS